jgi:hypothetical protein
MKTKEQTYREKMKAAGLVWSSIWHLPENKQKILQLQSEDKKKAAGEAK